MMHRYIMNISKIRQNLGQKGSISKKIYYYFFKFISSDATFTTHCYGDHLRIKPANVQVN